jgi:hypothetical protein
LFLIRSFRRGRTCVACELHSESEAFANFREVTTRLLTLRQLGFVGCGSQF